MGEGLGLGFCTWGSRESCLGFAGGFGVREEVDFVGYGASEVIKGLPDVGRVVVGFV